MKTVLSVFGTRPEAIKMAPLLRAMSVSKEIRSIVCVTGQHRTMLQQVLELFGIHADYNLDVMVPDQSLSGLSARIMGALDPVLQTVRPDIVLVHGDTTTAMAASLAAFHRGLDVGHVEAGLRTYDLSQPWPEELNRRVVDMIGQQLFAPTLRAKDNLLNERLQGEIIVTGNTVIDALRLTVERIESDAALRRQLDAKLPDLDRSRRLLLVTGHRRENFGQSFSDICDALVQLSKRPDIQIVYPVHLNPQVQRPVMQKLSNLANVHLVEPLDYLRFVRLMQRAHVVLTDSGGVQEEAPAIGKPVLVMRDVTERPEAVDAGTVQLVGTKPGTICRAVEKLYDSESQWKDFSRAANPYGDGFASERIVAALTNRPFAEFNPESTGLTVPMPLFLQ